MRCKSTISKEDCKLVNVNETVDIGAEKVMVIVVYTIISVLIVEKS